jgi:pimeloyl-ACP methyl ester carboxylesterase
MKTERTTIKNRRGLKLVIQVDTPDNPTNLAFVAHGQGGFKQEKHIQAFADAFMENNFRVVRFDATHALGESEGELIDVTYDNYIEDLQDVINWARTQDWFQQPFALCGHSMGAQSTAWYAEHHPEEVLCLAPMAPTINYELYIYTLDPAEKKLWQKQGYIKQASNSRPGLIKTIGWGVNETLKKYDLLPQANNLTMPTLVVVGEFDEPCPPKNQKILIDSLGSDNKKLLIIKNANHNYRNPSTQQYGAELQEAKTALSTWLHSL